MTRDADAVKEAVAAVMARQMDRRAGGPVGVYTGDLLVEVAGGGARR